MGRARWFQEASGCIRDVSEEFYEIPVHFLGF